MRYLYELFTAIIKSVLLAEGIWAALYIYLFFRMLKENKEREDRYQAMIDRLSGNIEEGIEDIQSRLDAMEKRQNDA